MSLAVVDQSGEELQEQLVPVSLLLVLASSFWRMSRFIINCMAAPKVNYRLPLYNRLDPVLVKRGGGNRGIVS